MISFFRALADTDADGKMDVNEFSIACKLINLKLRGYQIPKVLPPSLLASLKTNTPPAIPPLPNASLINAPPRPEPPKPVLSQNQAFQPQQLPPNLNIMPQVPPVGIGNGMTSIPPVGISTGIPPPIGIPTGVIPPMPTMFTPQQHPLVGIGNTQPLVNQVLPTVFGGNTPAISSSIPLILPTGSNPAASTSMTPTPLISSSGTVVSAHGIVTNLSNATSGSAPLTGTGPGSNMSPVRPTTAEVTDMGPGATSTPRSSIASLEKAASVESP